MDIRSLNQKTAAALLSVTARTLRDWTDAPRNADGSYDGPALVQWFAERNAGRDLDPAQERARKDFELANKYGLENKLRRGELHEAEAVLAGWSNVLVACRSRLLRLPSECAADAPPDLRAQVQATVQRGVHEALHELAQWPETQGEA